ncbi:CoA ester lyase [Mycolicibacterium goodii]|uniref:HpcH/HpaI aldolase/citrate lyase family protein n=1 Tax=Mycolicibacterium goodii TaxID=134601 RepID=UPI00094034C9|nr:CoA ester lyase [Mycolicibacterium goodii]MBU8810561.1 CoA ester lyase [Mycolicibacterium goodii]OKH75884.1 citrate lyase subunit beta [Mycobacterium sp. SWH-M5]PJK22285.1 CoA ester lyase [Mycolicibacterium goodii]
MGLATTGPAWLFCPGDRPERFGKAAAAADVVILDLEDGAGDKPAARQALLSTPLDPARTVVRINPGDSPEQKLDLDVLSQTGYTTVMLPKCESAAQVTALAPLDVVLIVETPLGALKVDETAAAANTWGVMWGAEDLFGYLGGTNNRFPDDSYRDVAKYVRSRSLLAAKAFGKQALDSVYIDIKNLDGLRAEVDDAVAVGFDIKVAIHPSQVAVIREGYTPTPEQVQWARKLLAAAEAQPGAFAFDGVMVDAPVLRRAGRIAALAPGNG